MPPVEINLLAIDRGTVVAPAGCGKTHLIGETLKHYDAKKPILVLTHTNAGVVALRNRMDRAGVSPKAYRLSTIDGWAMRLITTYPARSEHDPDLLNLSHPGSDYPNIRVAAARLLRSGHISDVVAATYDRLIVDEYQDCSVRQHALIGLAAQILPTCVLGDPLQAIFGFGDDGLAAWEDVCAYFPVAGKLSTPWRWKNAGTERLGLWLLEARRKLLAGEEIDLRTGPPNVTWVELDGSNDHENRLKAARIKLPEDDGRVLIIADSTSPDSQRRYASQTPGAVTVEAVDLRDLLSFARAFNLAAPDALDRVANFAQSVMSNVGAPDLIRRVRTLERGAARNAATSVEQAGQMLVQAPSHRRVIDLLVEIGKEGGVRTYRPAVLRASLKALELCDGPEAISFHEAAIKIREQNRIVGRPLPKRAVGSTLLLKGLEAEAVVVLNPDALNAPNLYVAMTRGSKKLVICSKTPILNPH
jgi:hypothetical protein